MRRKRNAELTAKISEMTRAYLDRHDLTYDGMIQQINEHLSPLSQRTHMAPFLWVSARRMPDPDMMDIVTTRAIGSTLFNEWAWPVWQLMQSSV